jgi:hypothetical protein
VEAVVLVQSVIVDVEHVLGQHAHAQELLHPIADALELDVLRLPGLQLASTRWTRALTAQLVVAALAQAVAFWTAATAHTNFWM